MVASLLAIEIFIVQVMSFSLLDLVALQLSLPIATASPNSVSEKKEAKRCVYFLGAVLPY